MGALFHFAHPHKQRNIKSSEKCACFHSLTSQKQHMVISRFDEMYARTLTKKIKGTTLAKGRNHGGVSIRIEPFFYDSFIRMFASKKIEGWKIRRSTIAGQEKIIIKVRKNFSYLDDYFGDSWRKLDVVVVSKSDGKCYPDGWWELRTNYPLTITYNIELDSFQLSYRIRRKNQHGVFIGS